MLVRCLPPKAVEEFNLSVLMGIAVLHARNLQTISMMPLSKAHLSKLTLAQVKD